MYRELKMRGSIIDEEDRVKLLPNEEQLNRVEGVWNLSSDQVLHVTLRFPLRSSLLQGNLGQLILTNVRLVWFASVNTYYNISLPYLQLVAI